MGDRRARVAPAARHPAAGNADAREADRRRDAAAVPVVLLPRPLRRRAAADGRSSSPSGRAGSGSCPAGRRQRLSVACVLAGDPDLLFLDEPTTGLDPQSRRQLWDVLARLSRRKAAPMLLTTHYMDEAEALCDRVAIVDHGHVIALGTPRELIASLGAPKVVTHEGTLEDVFMALTGRHLRERVDGSRRRPSSARRAHARPASRVRPRAGGAVLGVHLSDHAVARAGVAFPGGGATVGRGRSAARRGIRRRATGARGRRGIEVRTVDRRAELRALREGEVHIVVHPGDPPSTATTRRARRAAPRGCSSTTC